MDAPVLLQGDNTFHPPFVSMDAPVLLQGDNTFNPPFVSMVAPAPPFVSMVAPVPLQGDNTFHPPFVSMVAPVLPRGNDIFEADDSVQEPPNYMNHMPLYKAALRGDWKSAKRITNNNLEALTQQLGDLEETALHVAASTGHSNVFVQKLVDLVPPKKLWLKDIKGKTALHNAAIAGNTEAAKIMLRRGSEVVEEDLKLVKEENNKKYTPIQLAAKRGNKETIQFLLQETMKDDPSQLSDSKGLKLLESLISADFYGIAVYLVKKYPRLAITRKKSGATALFMLACKPQAFASGDLHGCFQHLLYRCLVGKSMETDNGTQGGGGGDVENRVEDSEKYLQESDNGTQGGSGKDVENRVEDSEKYPQESKHFGFGFGFIKTMHDKILKHKQAMELLRLLIAETLKSSDALILLGYSLHIAAENGIHEYIVEIIKAYPPSIFLRNENRNTFFHQAVLARQEKVFNLLYQMSSIKQDAISKKDLAGNNMLHLAGFLLPSNKISGAALQMQRELQWFEAVEKVIEPSYKEKKNFEGQTPRELFTERHSSLVKEGENWMKTTAESCTIVAALVVTVVFAAAFTVPGGNNSEGTPIYLNDRSFMIFAMADALALFSSATSLLMFLGILTSRYSERDFLSSLPKKLCIGLIMLFFSIAAMLVAFSASMHIVLFRRVSWIAVPIGLLACVPVVLFAFLQFPLLLEVVLSTFGPSIFRKQSNEIIM